MLTLGVFYFAGIAPRRVEWYLRNRLQLKSNIKILACPQTLTAHGPMPSSTLGARSRRATKLPSSPFVHPKDTHRAVRITRLQETLFEAKLEQLRGCLPRTSLANPNLWAGNVCQGKPFKMTQVASPPPSCATEQQASSATGSRTSWRNESKLSSGVGGKKNDRTENTP